MLYSVRRLRRPSLLKSHNQVSLESGWIQVWISDKYECSGEWLQLDWLSMLWRFWVMIDGNHQGSEVLYGRIALSASPKPHCDLLGSFVSMNCFVYKGRFFERGPYWRPQHHFWTMNLGHYHGRLPRTSDLLVKWSILDLGVSCPVFKI